MGKKKLINYFNIYNFDCKINFSYNIKFLFFFYVIIK